MQLPTCQQLNFLSNTWHLGVILLEGVLLLMVEILHHLGCTKLCESWDRLLVNWCRISSINSSIQVNILDPESVTMATIFTSNRIWLKGINFEEIPPTPRNHFCSDGVVLILSAVRFFHGRQSQILDDFSDHFFSIIQQWRINFLTPTKWLPYV